MPPSCTTTLKICLRCSCEQHMRARYLQQRSAVVVQSSARHFNYKRISTQASKVRSLALCILRTLYTYAVVRFACRSAVQVSRFLSSCSVLTVPRLHPSMHCRATEASTCRKGSTHHASFGRDVRNSCPPLDPVVLPFFICAAELLIPVVRDGFILKL